MILIGWWTHIFCFTFCNILWCFIPFLIHSLRIHFRHSFLLLLIYIFLYHLSLSCYGTNSSEIKGTHPRYTSLDIKNVSFHNMNSRNFISQNFMVFQPELYLASLNTTNHYLRAEPTTLNLSLFHSCSRLFVHNLVFNFWIDYMSVKINIL